MIAARNGRFPSGPADRATVRNATVQILIGRQKIDVRVGAVDPEKAAAKAAAGG